MKLFLLCLAIAFIWLIVAAIKDAKLKAEAQEEVKGKTEEQLRTMVNSETNATKQKVFDEAYNEAVYARELREHKAAVKAAKKAEAPLRKEARDLGVRIASDRDGLITNKEEIESDIALLTRVRSQGLKYKFRQDGAIAGRDALEKRVAAAEKRMLEKARKEKAKAELKALKDENKRLQAELKKANANNIDIM